MTSGFLTASVSASVLKKMWSWPWTWPAVTKDSNFMLKPKLLFNFVGTFFIAVALLLGMAPALSAAEEAAPRQYSKRDSALYKDVFDQALYYEGLQYLHLDRLYRDIFRKKERSLNVNAYDEVPDSTFFTNRHARSALSSQELKNGPAKQGKPASGGEWSILKGKFGGITPGFFVKNKSGEKYLLKFDALDTLEIGTGTEAVASRFMHAIGYNVPEYHVVDIKKEEFGVGEGAKVFDESGFQKPLTVERLEEFLLFIPQTENGSYRASASRILEGEILGPTFFQGRRKNDPDDLIDHEDRREIRALQIFSSWLNNTDARQSNSLDALEGSTIRHYIIDFNSSFGATPRGAKPPMFGHEHMADFGDASKAFLGLGFWKKPWQKRWDAAGQKVDGPASYGYFDNEYFNPDLYRTQLPYYAFKDVTRADGFWAAKIIMKFTDEDIEALISTGEFSDPETSKRLTETLVKRRDLIGQYWFKQANPLDDFELTDSGGSYELRFEDLAVRYGFETKGDALYQIDVVGKEGKKRRRLAEEEVKESAFRIGREWLAEYSEIHLVIRAQRSNESGRSPYVRVEIQNGGGTPRLAGIVHQD
jgi:hypothetical protein